MPFSDIVVYVPKKFHNKFESNEFKYDGNYDTDKIKNFLIHETYIDFGFRIEFYFCLNFSTGLAGIRTQGIFSKKFS